MKSCPVAVLPSESVKYKILKTSPNNTPDKSSNKCPVYFEKSLIHRTWETLLAVIERQKSGLEKLRLFWQMWILWKFDRERSFVDKKTLS